MKLNKVLSLFVIVALVFISSVFSQQGGIALQQAPSWEIDAWFNLPADKKVLDVSDYEGKVLYLMAFQKW